MTNENQTPVPVSYKTKARLKDITSKRYAACRKWRKRTPERVYASHRAWADKHKAERAAYARERRKNMPGRYAAIKGKYRALQRGNPVINPQAVVQWMEDWHKKEFVLCYWCAKQFDPKSCQADHVVPLWKGGAHSIENLVISCERCNRHKNKSDPEVWKAKLQQARDLYFN